MRRMRDIPWYYYLLAIPAVGAALAIQYMMRNKYPDRTNVETAAVVKPSHFRETSAAGTEYDTSRRNPASRAGKTDINREKFGLDARKDASGASARDAAPKAVTPADEDIDTYAAMDEDMPAEGERPAKGMTPVKAKPSEFEGGDVNFNPSLVKLNAQKASAESASALSAEAEQKAAALAKKEAKESAAKEASASGASVKEAVVPAPGASSKETPGTLASHDASASGGRDPAATPPATAAGGAPSKEASAVASAEGASPGVPLNVPNACVAIEYRGDGMEHTKVTKEEWAKVMTHFHGAKGLLLAWLEKHRKEFPNRTAAIMESQIRNLKIQRPPPADEPDLAWRGIGVWSQEPGGDPVLRIGGGFVKLLLKQPERGKFELLRLVAQAWAPCELLRGDAGQPWEPMLKCLGVQEARACSNGTYSESGWAISTALATILGKPKCNIPAFAAPGAEGCLKKVPLPLSIAGLGRDRDKDAVYAQSGKGGSR